MAGIRARAVSTAARQAAGGAGQGDEAALDDRAEAGVVAAHGEDDEVGVGGDEVGLGPEGAGAVVGDRHPGDHRRGPVGPELLGRERPRVARVGAAEVGVGLVGGRDARGRGSDPAGLGVHRTRRVHVRRTTAAAGVVGQVDRHALCAQPRGVPLAPVRGVAVAVGRAVRRPGGAVAGGVGVADHQHVERLAGCGR